MYLHSLIRSVLVSALNFFEDGITRPLSHSLIRSVLRPDAPLFGAWRLGRRRPGECRAELSKYAAARPLFASPVIRSVLGYALQLFEDGITRRSAKLSQAAKPPLESRGALFECRATPYHRVDTGFNLRAPNSSPRAGISAGSALHLNLVSALRKARVSHPRLSCMIRGLSPIPRGGGIPEGKEGDCIPTLGAVSLIEGV